MASQLGIQAGALTSVRNYSDDVKVRDTLLKFYLAAALGPEDATNQQKLDAVMDYIERSIIQKARWYELNQRRAALEETVNGEIGLE